jgi:ABC-type xylose transport system permease subunit
MIYHRGCTRTLTADMADETTKQQQFWIGVVGLIILLIFLYFYRPFETYLLAQIPLIHFSNVVFWFACLVGIVSYAFAHWQSFRSEIFRNVTELNVDTLAFDTLQAAILAAVIFCAGATLQAIEVLSEYFVNRGPIFGAAFGEKILAIVLLVILAIVFYLLHYVVRAMRTGWRPKRPPHRAR